MEPIKERTTCSNCPVQTCSAKERRQSETQEQFRQRQALQERLCRIKHKILVVSGKGGVGKTTVAVNLAVALSLKERKVGLLDIDIHGPDVPKMLGVEGRKVTGASSSANSVQPTTLNPYRYSENLEVMSISFLLRDADSAVIWRGPLKSAIVRQFLKDVEWGELDYLIIDAPPGTGDEILSICQLLERPDGAVVVTTPQEVSVLDVRKSIDFLRRLNVPVLGVVENMSGLTCPHCGKKIDIFKSGGGEKLAGETNIPFLGRIPADPAVVEGSDSGYPIVVSKPDSSAAKQFVEIADKILSQHAVPPR
jgi:Mrp family chromosome partitioning ATPase